MSTPEPFLPKPIFPDLGSVISLVFCCKNIIVGWSHDDKLYKLPCGKIEEADFGEWKGVHWQFSCALAIERCGLRELEREVSTEVAEAITDYTRLAYERDVHSRQGKVLYTQYHFRGVLEREIPLWGRPIEYNEMDCPEYWPIMDALRLDTQFHGTGDKRTDKVVNPYHRIAIAKTLLEAADDPDNTPRDILNILQQEDFSEIPLGNKETCSLAEYPEKILELIRRRII